MELTAYKAANRADASFKSDGRRQRSGSFRRCGGIYLFALSLLTTAGCNSAKIEETVIVQPKNTVENKSLQPVRSANTFVAMPAHNEATVVTGRSGNRTLSPRQRAVEAAGDWTARAYKNLQQRADTQSLQAVRQARAALNRAAFETSRAGHTTWDTLSVTEEELARAENEIEHGARPAARARLLEVMRRLDRIGATNETQ